MVGAIKSEMQAEGVPFTSADIATADITSGFLASGNTAFFQAVVVPSYQLNGLSPDEITTLRAYEATFGIREVDAYNWANPAIGLNFPEVSGDIAGTTATVTAAGVAGGFGYLNGPVPYGIGSWSYVAEPLAGASLPAGATFSTLLSAPLSVNRSGSLIGVYSNAGVEQLVITSAFSFFQSQFKLVAHGIITWATRGVHFGYNRNNFTLDVDDAFSSDASWDPALNCTPGEDCLLNTEPPGVRMTPDDVTYAANWMQANGYQLTLAFNGFYADPVADPLTQSLVANKSAFRWLNHGFEHVYQGCVQDLSVVPWTCTTVNGNIVWTSQQTIYNEIQNNITLGQSLGLPFDVAEYLSGEHSGLVQLPQQPIDNENFALALSQAGITFIGSDASRETSARAVGSATTIPRHPTALYYNTSTRAQAADEYNWFYTSAADGGSGNCTATATCIAPIDVTTGFRSYIVPSDAAFDMGFILSNDPRPFYAHTANLTGDRLAYDLLDSILGTYRAAFTAQTPVLNLTLTQAATQLVRQQSWATDADSVTGYVQEGQVSIANPTGHVVPFTAPAGTTIVGNVLAPYGGEVSAWLAPGSVTGTLHNPQLAVTGSTFVVGQSGSMSISAAGIPTPTVSVTGTLPAGLTITPILGGWNITGTPAAGTGASYPLTVTTISAGYYQTDQVVLLVAQPPQITSAAAATAVIGVPFTFTVTSTGYPAATITRTGALPSGITFTNLGNGTATLAGTTSAAPKVFPITFTATNVGGVATQPFSLTVTRIPQITSSPSATAVLGKPFTFTITTAGSPTPTIAQTGALPAGITFTNLGNGTATLSGTAPTAAAGHSYPITLTATNNVGAATQAFSLTVTRSPGITSSASATAVSGIPFTFTITTVGSPTPAITRTGTLPSGITFTDLGDGTATLSGKASITAAEHSFPITFTATNSAGVATQAFTLMVEADYTSLVSVKPARLADTRPGYATVDGLFAGGGLREQGSTLELAVAGRGGVALDAAAVALNVTVAEPLRAGFVTVFPCGEDRPLASNLNFTAGAVVANAVIAKIGAGGKVCLFVSHDTQLIVDVSGYFSHTSSFQSINPARVLDTRPGYSTIDGLQQGEGIRTRATVTTLQITNRVTVPTDASSVVLNVTVTEAQGPGFITVYPCGSDMPTASNLNYLAGSTVANLVVTKVGGGTVCIYSSRDTHLVVDVNGYFPGVTAYQALDPARLLETRPQESTIDGRFLGGGLLAAGTVTELPVAGRGGVPSDAATVMLNVTVTEPTAPGFVTVYPCGTSTPLASNLNYDVGTTVAIAAIVQVGSDGTVCLFNSSPTQLVVDVSGFLPS